MNLFSSPTVLLAIGMLLSLAGFCSCVALPHPCQRMAAGALCLVLFVLAVIGGL